MNTKLRPLFALVTLLLASLACNLPSMVSGGDNATALPAPNQTLTALFAITPEVTATNTLPPVVTATQSSANPTATQSAGTNPTATTAAGTNPTATATRTSTWAPAATATIPGVRPRSPVVAKFLNTPPTLDGDWSEWKDLTTEYPATNVVYGRANWANEDDLAGSFHVGWDNNNLYVAVKVRDDQYVQKASGENIFKGDCIEILLDTKLQNDYYFAELSPDDFQLGISPGNPDPNGTREAYLWFPTSVKGSKTNVKVASRLENGIYRVEAAIPWSVFEVTPAAGAHMGFAVSVSDNDNTGENVQQSMVSNVAGRSLADPTTWGDLLLQK
jgi:hypothetical protein